MVPAILHTAAASAVPFSLNLAGHAAACLDMLLLNEIHIF